MSQELANEISKEFTEITNIKCTATYMEKGSTHTPTTLDSDKKGVYVFLIDEKICFKVGKANSKSQARWNSHHYSVDKSTPSTFAKSILKNLHILKKYFNQEDIEKFESILNKYSINQSEFKDSIKNLDKKKVKDLSNELNLKIWIKNNISRIEFLLENTDDNIDFDSNLLEALIQFRLKPIFEGKNA